MKSKLEVVARFYAAINHQDMQHFAADFDPDIVRVEFEGTPSAGSYRGIAAVQGKVQQGRGTWAEGSCDPERFFQSGDKVVVYVHARVRLKGSADWTGGRFADGFRLRQGRIIEYHSFAERQDALKWAGIEASQAP